MTGQAYCRSDEIVGDRKGKHPAHSPAMPDGHIEEAADKSHAVPEEIEVGLVLEEAAAGDGAAGAQRGIEGKAVVRTVAQIQAVGSVMQRDPLRLVFRRHAMLPVAARQVQLRGGGGHLRLAVTAENESLDAAMLKPRHLADGFTAELVFEAETCDQFASPEEYGVGVGEE